MGAMSEAERGEVVFVKLSEGERNDLKKFMTGQIQNILANEYGIGGTKTLKSQLDGAIAAQLNHDQFVDKIASRILHSHKINAAGVIKEALQAAAKKAVSDIVGEAASNIQVTFHIGEAKPAELNNDQFGKF